MKTLIIALAGESCVGKTETANIFRKFYRRARLFSYADVFRDFHAWVAEQYLDETGVWIAKKETDRQKQMLSEKLETLFGENALAQVFWKMIRNESSLPSLVLVDGIHSEMDVCLARMIPGVQLRVIYLEVSQEMRYLRHVSWSKNHQKVPLSKDEFFEREVNSEEHDQLAVLRDLADYLIVNDGDEASLVDSIHRIIADNHSHFAKGVR